MNKFVETLTRTHKGILADRASNLAAQAKLEQSRLVSDKEGIVLKLEQELNAASDLAPDSTTSLHPGGAGKAFDAQKWVSNLHSLKIKLLEARIELELAQQTFSEWFGEKPVKKTKTTS